MASQIDELDRRIIRVLQQDVRASYKSIATSLGVSHNTVRARMDRMTEAGVIRFAVVTSPHKVGFETTAFIGVRVDPQHIEAVGKAMAARREISYLGHTIGNQDVMALAHFENNQQLFKFTNQVVAAMPGVISIDVSIICETLRGLPDRYEPAINLTTADGGEPLVGENGYVGPDAMGEESRA